MNVKSQTLLTLVLLSQISLHFSCDNKSGPLSVNNRVTGDINSKNDASTYLPDNSQWICEAELVKPGIFAGWDFGYSEARHLFKVSKSLKGEIHGLIGVRQIVKDREFDFGEYYDSTFQIGGDYILLLKRQCDESVVGDSEDINLSVDNSTEIIFLEDIYGDFHTYELTDNQLGIVKKNEK